MQIILASANQGKIKELKQLLPLYDVIPYSDILGSFDIEETGDSFKQNAILKAKFVNNKLKEKKYDKPYIVISDDSGITVPALDNEPGIYSARYASINATDKQNNEKLISKLKEKNLTEAPAYYTAALAIAYKDSYYTTHGWMYGKVIDKQIGDGGFGYDPMFIPDGFEKTLGELDKKYKKEISHRTKALDLALKIIKALKL